MNDKIECLECHKLFGVITSQHLQSCCGLTIKKYKEKYPHAETISEKVKLVRQKNCKNMSGQTKTVKCSKCGDDMETAIVNHWDFICEKCREKETYPGKIYLPDKDLVVCQICFQGLEQITWMHTKLHNLTLQEYGKMFPKAWLTNKKIREDRRERGLNHNPAKRKEVRKKMSRVQTFTAEQWTERYPWIFPDIEKIRDNGFGNIEVKCKKCEKWFQPDGSQFGERVRSLKHGNDGSYLYCSDKCKGACSLYRLQPLEYIKEVSEKPFTDSEYQVFRNEVLKRQEYQYGYNFCEICESTKKLHIHHEKPQKTHPIMSLDPDNGIVLCEECHFKKAHIDSCSLANLANKICSQKNLTKK